MSHDNDTVANVLIGKREENQRPSFSEKPRLHPPKDFPSVQGDECHKPRMHGETGFCFIFPAACRGTEVQSCHTMMEDLRQPGKARLIKEIK
jgi:hypothetical protein